MAYTPINWQTGDTITAEKLNKMDNGWGVSAGTPSVVFSGTVTTEGEGPAVYALGIELTAQSIIVTLDGDEYELELSDGIYGDINFVDPPFLIDQYDGLFVTAVAGSHVLQIETAAVATVEVSQGFVSAVALHAVIGATTFQEVDDALAAGRIVLINASESFGTSCQVVCATNKTATPLEVYALNVTPSGASTATYLASSASSPIEAY